MPARDTAESAGLSHIKLPLEKLYKCTYHTPHFRHWQSAQERDNFNQPYVCVHVRQF